MKCREISAIAFCLAAVLLASLDLSAQNDPGPRTGPAAAGSSFPTLSGDEQALFNQALQVLQEIDSVSGTIAGEPGSGLGPAFNGNSCTQCHAQPAPAGSSPGLNSPQNSIQNPQIALATLDGATNAVPSFISANGPMLEARFIRNADGTPDGGVHDLYTIRGRSDAPGCNLSQPDFATAQSQNNVIFRIPTPIFGLGLVEATPDQALIDNLNSTAAARASLGIGGSFNTSGNDGTITRFGWKAQNKSLLIFSGEAYNVEMGVANELFPNERSAVAGCVFNSSPEDRTHMLSEGGSSTGTASEMSSDAVNFALFARLSAAPTPAAPTSSTQKGAALFSSIGCSLCHSPTLTTGQSPYTGMSNVRYHPYSDFALHKMGNDLQDGITQGAAKGNQFRTAPLWGLGQRLFFLHDGRTTSLIQAIQAHSGTGSEANKVINNYNRLKASPKQDLLNFLRSL
ncbi:MAG TPA: di-heme oxidoredictase family protein [Candidatus Sulfotelmatobacter sp.]|nr:di-heme oxidoredictase family protein [Candidatus Sulfotelmatobacter sp.]